MAIVIGCIALGFVIGWLVCQHHYVRSFGEILEYFGITNDDLEEMNSKLLISIRRKENDEPEEEVEITVEEVNGKLFAYSRHNPRFLAQGNTAEELLVALTEKLGDKSVIISKDDPCYHYFKTED